jgi:hypothetical protein
MSSDSCQLMRHSVQMMNLIGLLGFSAMALADDFFLLRLQDVFEEDNESETSEGTKKLYPGTTNRIKEEEER